MSKRTAKNNESKENRSKKRTIVDWLYVKLLKDPSTNVIIVIVSFVFIVWMVVPLLLVLSSGVYFNGQWSGKPIENVFTDNIFFNWAGDNTTYFHQKTESEYGGPSVNLAYYKNILYVAERGDGIEVLNTSDPSNIYELTQYHDIESSIGDLEIYDGTLFAAAGKTGLLILNVSNPQEAIHVISSYPVETNHTNFIHVYNNLAILDKDGEGFIIFDVSDLENPVQLSNVTIGTDVYNVDVWNNYLFVVGYTTGLLVYDITDPTQPQVIASYNSTSETGRLLSYDITIIDGLAYVATGKYDGLVVLNITNPTNVSYVSNFDEVNAMRLSIVGDYAYCVLQNDVTFEYGMGVVNISDPYAMSLVGSKLYIGIRTADILVDENRKIAFLAQLGDGTYVLDINNFSDIIQLDSYVDTITITTHIFSGKNYGVVLNTIILGIFTTLFSILLGSSLAFILARYEFPGKRVVSLLALAPLIIPPFISGMGFRLLLGPNGFLNNLIFIPLFNTQIILQGFVAICFVQTFHFYALVYLNAFSSFLNVDPSLEEQAENLGASSFKLFFSVTLPLALPGIGAGAILVLILSMEDVGTPIIFANMGDDMAKNYLTYYVFGNFQKAGSEAITPEVCVLGAILLIIALAGFFAIRKYVSLRQYAMISKGRAGSYRMSKAGWKLIIFYPYLIILFALSLLVHVGVFLMSIMETLGVT
ncbi:MAG: ABC transporter permease subunit, partial [Candidatus Heimdallarchaeaceae archaeon]